MTLLNELKREFNTAIIMITHDLGVVAGICDQVMVMYAGRTMEYGTAEQIFYHPTHPYSIGLMDAIPRLDGNEEHLGPFLAIHRIYCICQKVVHSHLVANLLLNNAKLRQN